MMMMMNVESNLIEAIINIWSLVALQIEILLVINCVSPNKRYAFFFLLTKESEERKIDT